MTNYEKIRSRAVTVNNVEYALVKVEGAPHSFVQIASVPGMETTKWHSINRYFLASVPCIMFKSGVWDVFWSMYLDSICPLKDTGVRYPDEFLPPFDFDG